MEQIIFVALRGKPAGKQEQQSRHRALFIPKEGKETLEVNLGKNMVSRPKRMGSGVGYAKGRYQHPYASVVLYGIHAQKEGKMVAKHCSNSHTLAERDTRKQTRLTRQDIASWAYLVYQAQTSESKQFGLGKRHMLARISHPMHTYLLGREKNQSIRSSADTHTNKHRQRQTWSLNANHWTYISIRT